MRQLVAMSNKTISNEDFIQTERITKSKLVEGLSFYHKSAFYHHNLIAIYCMGFNQVGEKYNSTPSPIVHLVSFNSRAICTPSGGTRPLPPWLGSPALVHSVDSDTVPWGFDWGYPRHIWETDNLMALQLTLDPMLNLTALVFTIVPWYGKKTNFKIMVVYKTEDK